MDLNFVLDENYLALFILNTKMHNESKEIQNIKNRLYSDNNLGYKKILEEELLDSSVYLKDKNVQELIDEFISTNKFNEIYKTHSSETRETVAIKVLKNVIDINDDELNKTKDDLWLKHINGYWKLLSMNSYDTPIFFLDEDVRKVIDYFKSTDEFKKLYNETKLYLENIKKYWEESKDEINKYLKRTLKINFNIDLIVYISHPNTYEGYSFDSNKIAWGHYKGIEDLNYNITYLVHEALHCLLPFDKEDTDIDGYIKHSIIELISDYELYSLLKGESTLKEGHQFLNEYKKFIYPYWLKYIGLNDYQIKRRLERDSVSPNDLIDLENIDISNINIHEFIRFCVNKYMIIVSKSTNKKINK